MFSEERQIKISELLKEKSSIKVNELSNVFKVSESTIRRDLQEMEAKGFLARTHGGAVSKEKAIFEPSFKEKEDKRYIEKLYIGKIAAAMIEDGDTIILDSGTTTLQLAKCIKAKNITVITNSIDIASELSNRNDIEIIVTGGAFRITTRALVGPISEGVLKNFKVDKAFIGANGISIKEGITTPNLLEAHMKREMMKAAGKVILAADSSKFNQVSFAVIGPVTAVDLIITNSDLNENVVKEYKDIGVEIIKKGNEELW
ncbi:DeoR/GlpR family DNA-binding transcription regulator [Candidatus Clostridium radicumherbarum]|uniref:DeoR/GlpR family DNA-binding transcription regulator n=1 Tax=Candidatus Clostridium radicumherbarum TaxID=3381662 RepID=A0ABW8TM86_9CLOT